MSEGGREKARRERRVERRRARDIIQKAIDEAAALLSDDSDLHSLSFNAGGRRSMLIDLNETEQAKARRERAENYRAFALELLGEPEGCSVCGKPSEPAHLCKDCIHVMHGSAGEILQRNLIVQGLVQETVDAVRAFLRELFQPGGIVLEQVKKHLLDDEALGKDRAGGVGIHENSPVVGDGDPTVADAGKGENAFPGGGKG